MVRFPNSILMAYTVTIAMYQPVEIWNKIHAMVDILPPLLLFYFTRDTNKEKCKK